MYSIVLATILAGAEVTPGQWGCSCSGPRYSAYQGCYGHSSYYGGSGCHGTSVYYGSSCSCRGSMCSGGIRAPHVMPIPAAPVPVPLAVPTPAPPSQAPGVGTPPSTLEPPAREELSSAHLTARVSATSATLTVRLPADAKLYVDDEICPLTSSLRTFTSAGLEQGRQYYYLLRMEVVRNGQTLVQSQRVQFEAGRRIEVSFADLGDVRSVKR